jgi:protein FrlC
VIDALSQIELCGANFGFLRTPLEEWLDQMVALEFASIEFWAASPHLYVGDVKLAEVRKLQRSIASRRLKLICLTPEQVSYPINLAAREPEGRRRSLAYFSRALEVCEALQAPLLLVTAGWGYADEPEQDVIGRATASLAELADHAEREGVTLVLEALQPFESPIANCAAQLAALAAEIDSSHLGIVLDTVAMSVAGDTVSEYLTRFGANVRHCHLVDGTPSGHLAWGDGSLPMRKLLTELIGGGYRGAFSFEVLNRRYWRDPSEPIRRSRDAAAKVLDELTTGAQE